MLSYYESLSPSSPCTPTGSAPACSQNVTIVHNTQVPQRGAVRACKRPSYSDSFGTHKKRTFGLGVNVSSANADSISHNPQVIDLTLMEEDCVKYPQVGSVGSGKTMATHAGYGNGLRDTSVPRPTVTPSLQQFSRPKVTLLHQIPGSTVTPSFHQYVPRSEATPSLPSSTAKPHQSSLSDEQKARMERNRKAALERRRARAQQASVQ